MQGQPGLTQGAIRRLLDDEKNLQPVVQCIGAKPLTNQQEPGNAPPRFRLAISDGEHWCTAMLATQMNEKVSKGLVGNLSVMRLTDYLTSFSQDKKIVIILNLDNLGVASDTIGQPRSLETPKNLPQQQQQHGVPTSNQPPSNQATQRYQGSSGPPTGGYGQQPGKSYGQGSGFGMNAYGQQPNHHPGDTGNPGQQNGSYGAANGPIAGGYGQAPNYRSNNAPIARDENAPRIMPINSLNAYQNRWTVKARITQRSEMRRYTTARGDGKFFSVDLLDAEGGEIRAVAFNQVADQFDEVLQTGKLILLSKATLKPKKPGSTYNQTRHDHEMTLEKSTVIREIQDDEEAAKIPQIIYRFRKIGDVENCAPTTQVDVVGIVESVEPPSTITRRDGGETTKRSLTIKDDSNHSIELTLWGGVCSSPGDELDALVNGQGERPVLACKSVRVGEFGGRSLSTISSTQMAVNPDHPASAALRDWYNNKGGAMTEATKLSGQRGSGAGRSDRRVTFAMIEDERLGTSGNPDYVAVSCTITMVKDENMYYPACSLQYNSRPCNKKLSNNSGDGQNWWCDRCQQEARPDWRYILTVKADDHTGGMYLTAFQEAGTQIMGMPASELREGDDGVLEKAKLEATHQPLMLKLKIAEESYNDETRVKKNIMRADKLDFVKESRVILDFIRKLGRGESVMQGAPQTGGGGYGAVAYGGGMNGGATTPVQIGYGGAGNGYGGGGNAYGGGGHVGGGNSYGQTGNQGVYGGAGNWGGF